MPAQKSRPFHSDGSTTRGLQTERSAHGTVIVRLSQHQASAIRALTEPQHVTLLDHLRAELSLDPETPIEVDIGPMTSPKSRLSL